jgi:hypothetical protein
MVQRKIIDVGDDRQILLTTERLADGAWAVVASILEATPNGERVVDLPVIEQRFPTEADAETFGETQARRWIEHNVPRAA